MKIETKYLKEVVGGTLSGVCRAETQEYYERFVKLGYVEISKEEYDKIMSYDELAISYNYG